MSKRELPVGTKIKCVGPLGKGGYFANDDWPHGAVIMGFPGGPGLLNIRFYWNGVPQNGTIHRRQVTHFLVPRKKPCPPPAEERVKLFVEDEPDGFRRYKDPTWWMAWDDKSPIVDKGQNPICLVELKPSEVIVDRASLAAAWDRVVNSHIAFEEYDSAGPILKAFAKALGLEVSAP